MSEVLSEKALYKAMSTHGLQAVPGSPIVKSGRVLVDARASRAFELKNRRYVARKATEEEIAVAKQAIDEFRIQKNPSKFFSTW